jgi:fimbrial isopeptide formation D2 family protein/LPXTG-motif cell wall-anchored protein
MKRRILPILLSAALAFAMPMTAFADTDAAGTEKNVDTSSLTSEADTATHSYEAFQIFTGNYEYDKDHNIRFTNVAYGSDFAAAKSAIDGAFSTLGIAFVDIDKDGTAGNSAADYAATFEKLDTTAKAEAMAKAIFTALKESTGVTVTKDGNRHNISAGEGYYLIVDKTIFDEGEEAYTDRAQLQRVYANGVVAINSKHTTVENWKKVRDINDSVEVENPWGETADYDIGDEVPFQLSATVPSDFADYEEYEYIFHDVQDEALVFDSTSVVVKVDGNVVSSGYEVKTENIGEDTFQVYIADLNDLDGLTANSTITVEYKSTLDGTNIKFGNEISEAYKVPGNPNKMRVTFDNKQGGKGKTPWKIAIVFTFRTTVYKVNSQLQPLNGAEFTLTKYYSKEDTWKTVSVIKASSNNDEITDLFKFDGIDDGRYRIEETVVPAGYNKAPDVTFDVDVVHDTNVDPHQVTKITVTDVDTGEVIGSTDGTLVQVATFDMLPNNSGITETVINQEGAILPSTGGIGTTIFYVIGGVLVVGAVVLLIVRRRMRNEEE